MPGRINLVLVFISCNISMSLLENTSSFLTMFFVVIGGENVLNLASSGFKSVVILGS